MYPNFINDRKALGFQVLKDEKSIEDLMALFDFSHSSLILLKNLVYSLVYNNTFQSAIYREYEKNYKCKPRRQNFYRYLVNKAIIIAVWISVTFGSINELNNSYSTGFDNIPSNRDSIERVVESPFKSLSAIRGGDRETQDYDKVMNEIRRDRAKMKSQAKKQASQKGKLEMSRALAKTSSAPPFQKAVKSGVKIIGKGARKVGSFLLQADPKLVYDGLKIFNGPAKNFPSVGETNKNILRPQIDFSSDPVNIETIAANNKHNSILPTIQTRSTIAQQRNLKIAVSSEKANDVKSQPVVKQLKPGSNPMPGPSSILKKPTASPGIFVEGFIRLDGSLNRPGNSLTSGMFGNKPADKITSFADLSNQINSILDPSRTAGSKIPLSMTNAYDQGSRLPSQKPTKELFSVDVNNKGLVRNKRTAYNHFKSRMMEVATKNHNLNDQRREVFLERLDKCSFQRFCELAQEGGKMTYGTIREAETFLQAEFLDLIEDGSIRRPTEAEVKSGNTLDGRFKVGLLNGQSDTKNKQWTDGDSKVLVEEKIMRYHAAQIASQEGKKGKDPGITTAYEQGKRTGMKIVEQKYKNVKSESPHSPNAVENILHLTNLLDLPLSESQQAKQGIKDGIIETIAKNKKDIAMKYGIPEEAISAENVMSNTLIMNDDYTIPRIE